MPPVRLVGLGTTIWQFRGCRGCSSTAASSLEVKEEKDTERSALCPEERLGWGNKLFLVTFKKWFIETGKEPSINCVVLVGGGG